MSTVINMLKEKFTEYQIPVSIADSFLANYFLFEEGLFPEIELSNIPSDECFKTLRMYCNNIKETPDVLLVHKLLNTPFSDLQATQDKLKTFIDVAVIEKNYHRSEMFFVKPEFVDKLKTFFESKKIQQTYCSNWFVDALLLGEDALDRVEELFKLLDECTAKKIIFEATIWYPASDPIGLITYLLENGLTNDQICKLLLKEPTLTMYYREKSCRSLKFGHDQEYVDYVISKIKKGEER